jgi:NADH:ubiquinone oxidoreductase subunit 3 (subunit A)
MKKHHYCTLIIAVVGVALTIAGAVLLGVRQSMTPRFNLVPLAEVLTDIGIIIAVLAGIVLVAMGIAKAITHHHEDTKK